MCMFFPGRISDLLFPLFLCIPLQLPSTGQLPAVRDGPFQTGGVPTVLPALAHRQSERVGRRRGSCWRSSAENPAGMKSRGGKADNHSVSVLSCCSTWTRRSSPWLFRLLWTREKVSCWVWFWLMWLYSSRDLIQRSVFSRTFGPLSHPASYVWEGKTETQLNLIF